MSGVVRSGIHPHLEDEANAIIFDSLKGETSRTAKSDILTPWKEADRRAREVLSSTGTIDSSTRRGIYGRARNTRQSHLNSRDGVAAALTTRTGHQDFDGDWPGSFS